MMGTRFFRLGLLGLIVVLAGSASSARAAEPRASVSARISPPVLGDSAELLVTLDIATGLHAQSHEPLDENLIAFSIQVNPVEGLKIGDPVYPAGQIVQYPMLGKLSVYSESITVRVPIQRVGPVPIGARLIGSVSYQICDDQTCFRPETEKIDLPLTIDPSVTPSASSAASETPVSFLGWNFTLRGDEILLPMLIALIAGIIFNVMPCVLPVMPLKAIGFYEVSQHHRARTLLYGLVFSLGIIAIFAVLALILLLSKSLFGQRFNWGQQFSYPWFVWTIAIVLAALGFGMLGGFSFSLPRGIYGLNFRHDTYSGNFLWGALTAILSTPCTAPLFPPLLAWAVLQPLLVGVASVLMVGVGMALPYLILSAFPELARRFPRTGPASELVKQMMGFLLLASAAFFAGLRLLPDPQQWWAVFAVVVWACLYLVVRTPQLTSKSVPLFVVTALAVAIVAGGLVLSLRLTDTAPGVAMAEGESAARVSETWQAYSAETFAAAKKSNRIVLVKFTAAWCLNCKYIETTVYHDPTALAALRDHNVAALKADLTESDAPGWKLLDELGGNGIPFTAIYPPGSNVPITLSSIYTTPTLIQALEQAGAGAAPTTRRFQPD